MGLLFTYFVFLTCLYNFFFGIPSVPPPPQVIFDAFINNLTLFPLFYHRRNDEFESLRFYNQRSELLAIFTKLKTFFLVNSKFNLFRLIFMCIFFCSFKFRNLQPPTKSFALWRIQIATSYAANYQHVSNRYIITKIYPPTIVISKRLITKVKKMLFKTNIIIKMKTKYILRIAFQNTYRILIYGSFSNRPKREKKHPTTSKHQKQSHSVYF